MRLTLPKDDKSCGMEKDSPARGSDRVKPRISGGRFCRRLTRAFGGGLFAGDGMVAKDVPPWMRGSCLAH